MTNTFARWPRPEEGRVEFTADCPCGNTALWEQRGSGPGAEYSITCRRCSRR